MPGLENSPVMVGKGRYVYYRGGGGGGVGRSFGGEGHQ